jgi:hypothetical protein
MLDTSKEANQVKAYDINSQTNAFAAFWTIKMQTSASFNICRYIYDLHIEIRVFPATFLYYRQPK